MNNSIKTWIDGASYEELLRKWRFAEIGDSMFQGETGEYFAKVMSEKRNTADHVQASKCLDWGN